MTSVTIFGAGNMGTAIDEVLTAGGATVDHIRSADPPGPVTGEIVVLAVPHPALNDILDKYGDQLAGKIVVDITNPLNFETFDSLVVSPDSSKAAELAAALPSSRVIKAFNTTLAATLNQRQVGPVATTVWLQGMTPTRSLLSSRPSKPAVWMPSTLARCLAPANLKRWASCRSC